jgi:phosphatidylserine/phosphatidylglycerophosphate/cardiolipin synthase-like enzyme
MIRPRTTATTLLIVALMVSPIVADQIFTSPGGGARAALVDAIDHATTSIDVFAYAFTSRDLVDALARAAHRGVTVRVLLDRLQSTQRASKANDLRDHVHFAALATTRGSMHAKTIILDHASVWIGSYNFTDAAETKNVEHLMQIDSPALASTLTAHFDRLATQSIPIPRTAPAVTTPAPCKSCTRNPNPSLSRRRPQPWSN